MDFKVLIVLEIKRLLILAWICEKLFILCCELDRRIFFKFSCSGLQLKDKLALLYCTLWDIKKHTKMCFAITFVKLD